MSAYRRIAGADCYISLLSSYHFGPWYNLFHYHCTIAALRVTVVHGFLARTLDY